MRNANQLKALALTMRTTGYQLTLRAVLFTAAEQNRINQKGYRKKAARLVHANLVLAQSTRRISTHHQDSYL